MSGRGTGGKGKAHRHDPGPSHCRDAGIRDKLEVIRRHRADLALPARAPPPDVSWSAWSLGRRPAVFPAAKMRRASSTLKAEASTKTSQNRASPAAPTQGSARSTRRATYPARSSPEFWWNRVGAEKSRDQSHGLAVREIPIDPEQLELVLPVESVSALAFDRRHPEGQHLAEKSGGPLGQRLLARFPRQSDGASDPAAGPCDIEIAASPDPLLELVGSPSAEREMGMAVHEPGDDESAGGIESLACARYSVGNALAGPDPADVSPSHTTAASAMAWMSPWPPSARQVASWPMFWRRFMLAIGYKLPASEAND